LLREIEKTIAKKQIGYQIDKLVRYVYLLWNFWKLSFSACVIASKRSMRGNLCSINLEIALSLRFSQWRFLLFQRFLIFKMRCYCF